MMIRVNRAAAYTNKEIHETKIRYVKTEYTKSDVNEIYFFLAFFFFISNQNQIEELSKLIIGELYQPA